MKIFFILILISSNTFARTIGECLDESISTNLAYKVVRATESSNGSQCSNLDQEGFKSLYEHRENQKRFRNQVVKNFKKTNKFDLRELSDIDEPNPGEADEARTCAYTNVKNNSLLRSLFADKYPQLKDCPAAVDAFKTSMSKSGILEAPLYEICGIVQKAEEDLKNALGGCKGEVKITEEKGPHEIQRAQFSSFGNTGTRASRATEQ